MNDDRDFLQPYFLGPAAENDALLEALIVEFVRDHVFWRRNFHPEDGQRIRPGARHRAEFLEFEARLRTELYQLSAELKRAVPFFHPRYLGHMSSDLLLPGLITKIVTTLYNPNNVSEDASPVTLDKELKVGAQLASMFGFAIDESAEPCAWGHLTSGGTVANYEALWNFRALKYYPIALQAGAKICGFDPADVGPARKRLSEYSKWELLNLTIDETIELRRSVARLARGLTDRQDFYDFSKAVRCERIESLGLAGFYRQHDELGMPRLLVPVSAHYSWEKGMKVLGFGTANLCGVCVDSHMRLDPGHLRECLTTANGAESPVLGVIGILGSTEFGTCDPIHEIVAERRRWRQRGLDFGIHVDAAWGGYLTSVFRRPDGSFIDREVIGQEFEYFPSPLVYDAFQALSEVDSITIDPHKLGYMPYAAGAFVARNREVVDFVSQKAAYVFDLGDETTEVSRSDSLHNLGQYILEGSKSGASAASVYVTHKVLPLDNEGMGRLLKLTIKSAEYFWKSAQQIKVRLADRVTLTVPFEPDSNLICLALNPRGNNCQAVMNRFGRRVFAHMRVEPQRPVQMTTFIGSYTSLQKEKLPGDEASRILDELGIAPATFVLVPQDDEREADHIFLLRHTLMNPWTLSGPGEKSYIDLYWEYLEQVVDGVLAAPDDWHYPTTGATA